MARLSNIRIKESTFFDTLLYVEMRHWLEINNKNKTTHKEQSAAKSIQSHQLQIDFVYLNLI